MTSEDADSGPGLDVLEGARSPRRGRRTTLVAGVALVVAGLLAVALGGGDAGADRAAPAAAPRATGIPTAAGGSTGTYTMVSVPTGPQRLHRPIRLRPVLAEQAAENCIGTAPDTVPARRGGECYRLGPSALAIRRVHDLGSGPASGGDGPGSSDSVLTLTLTRSDQARLASLTDRLQGRRLAVVAGGRVYSAPYVRSRLDAGQLAIVLGDGDMVAFLLLVTG